MNEELDHRRAPPIPLPCGGLSIFDPGSTAYAYRCNRCFAVVGSVGMPRECAEMLDELVAKAAKP